MPSNYEILAPCGGIDSVYAAVKGGADSVYLGAKAYNARAYAQNLDNSEIKEAIDYCHLRGVKVYITFNTLYKEEEADGVLSLASELYAMGADAFITADIGIFGLFKAYFPHIKINASTQMTVHNSDTALALKAMGADRIILSRELSLSDIASIYNALGDTPDLEAFVHGALCVCYSGRCLYSSFAGGRSGNRGRCAQPCRMGYTLLKNGKKAAVGALLSPKDIMNLGNMSSLVKAGVKAFKIEGRMKGEGYVYETAKIYKKYLNAALKTGENTILQKNDLDILAQVYSRGGEFSGGGYLNGKCGKAMLSKTVKHTGREIGVVTSSAKDGCFCKFYENLSCGNGIALLGKDEGLNISKEITKGKTVFLRLKGEKGDKIFLSYDKNLSDHLKSEIKTTERTIPIKAEVTIKEGNSSKLILKYNNIEVTAEGKAPEKAENRPTEASEIISRLSKTGGTPFSLTFTKTEIDKNIFIPIRDLNELRRTACTLLSDAITRSYERKAPVLPQANRLKKSQKLQELQNENLTPCLYAEVSTKAQLEAVLSLPVKRIYINDERLLKQALNPKEKEIYFTLPHIIKEDRLNHIKELVKGLENTEIDGYLTRSLTALKTDKKIVCDHTLGVFNSHTAEKLLSLYSGVTLSTELSMQELKPLCGKNTEVIAYGRLPLMVTEQCPIGNFCGNAKSRFCRLKGNTDTFALKDRTGALCPLKPDCESCLCQILSPEPISEPRAAQLKTQALRLIFTTESGEETAEITKAYLSLINNKNDNNNKTQTLPFKGRQLKGVR